MPTKSTSTGSRPVSRALAKKNEADILNPTPTPFVFQGASYAISPMPDRIRMKLADEFGVVLSLFESLGKRDLEKIQPSDLLPILPQAVRLLIPNATAIVSACTGIDEETVSDRMSLGKKAQALMLILRAEDFPLLLQSFGSMVADFRLPATETMEE